MALKPLTTEERQYLSAWVANVRQMMMDFTDMPEVSDRPELDTLSEITMFTLEHLQTRLREVV